MPQHNAHVIRNILTMSPVRGLGGHITRPESERSIALFMFPKAVSPAMSRMTTQIIILLRLAGSSSLTDTRQAARTQALTSTVLPMVGDIAMAGKTAGKPR